MHFQIRKVPTASAAGTAGDVNGGIVVAVGGLGRGELPEQTSQQYSLISTPDIQTGGTYRIAVSGKTVAEFTVSSVLTTQGDIGSAGPGGQGGR